MVLLSQMSGVEIRDAVCVLMQEGIGERTLRTHGLGASKHWMRTEQWMASTPSRPTRTSTASHIVVYLTCKDGIKLPSFLDCFMFL